MSPHHRRQPGTSTRIPTRRTVHARFSVREIPGIAVTAHGDGGDGDGGGGPADGELAASARRTAQRALAEAGRGYLGGRVELRTPGPPTRHPGHHHRPLARTAERTRRRAADRAVRRAADRAVALAVAATLRGETGDIRVRLRTTA
ncbi:hypothetical protein [Streptomyces sp. NPDC005805]|uniref:hypothetical protein n=1 Tax=Streptomyces sp. NPDC005805 TaxID=3157068 RepID=UPI0033E2901F